MERAMRIELTLPAWKAGVLPLNYARVLTPLKSACPAFSIIIVVGGISFAIHEYFYLSLSCSLKKASVLPLNYSRVIDRCRIRLRLSMIKIPVQASPDNRLRFLNSRFV